LFELTNVSGDYTLKGKESGGEEEQGRGRKVQGGGGGGGTRKEKGKFISHHEVLDPPSVNLIYSFHKFTLLLVVFVVAGFNSFLSGWH